MPEFLSAPAFMLWGTPATWLELTAALLALVMVGCNMREFHWGWPLAIASSLLYFGVFSQARIYGDASLQIFFALVAFWGWLQWLRGHRGDGGPLRVMRLSPRGIAWTLAACAFAWPAVSLFLHRFTDTDVPWWDGFATGLSLVGQFLLGRKFIENWLVWIAVNVVSVGLFIHKGLWLTVILGALFSAIQAYEYMHAPFPFKGINYGAAFFMATGFHGFHVLIGTIFLIVCLVRAYKGDFTPRQHFGFEAAAWYWHFVDVVWLFLFVTVYVWGGWGAPVHGG